ncbi:MAG: ATP-binding protein [Pseudomonadota bacterium]
MSTARTSVYGLRTYLAIAFTTLCLLLTIFLVMVVDLRVSRQVKADIGGNLREMSHHIGGQLDRAMSERWREVREMAERIDVSQGSAAMPANQAAIDSLQRTYPYYAWIGITDLSGKVLVSTGGALAGVDVSKRPWFGQAFNGIHVGDVHEAKLLAAILQAPGEEPLRFVDVAFPYKGADGKVAGVLGAHLSFAWAADVQQSIIEPVDVNRAVDALIVSFDDTVLLGPKDLQGKKLPAAVLRPAREDNAKGVSLARWPDGQEYLAAVNQSTGFGPFPGMGWQIVVREKADEAYKPVRELRAWVLLAGLGVALLFTLVGVAVARAITRPLGELSRAAAAVEAGATEQLSPVKVSYSELSTLTGAFTSLVDNLKRNEADLRELNVELEARVASRTQALGKALEQVQDNQQRLRTVVDTAQGAYVGADFKGVITDWNDQAQELLGWSREEIVGQPILALIPERFHKASRFALAHFHETGSAHLIVGNIERLVRKKDGSEMLAEIRTGVIDTPHLQLFSTFIYDISERKRVEQMKSEFVATTSHELRTPLTAIHASLDMINSGMAGPLPPPAKKLVEIAHQSSLRLVRLVNDILDVEKIESRQMVFDKVPQTLGPVLEQAVMATRSFAEEFDVDFAIDVAADAESVVVEVDTDRVQQVLVNLLSNAAKIAPAGSVVGVGLALVDGRLRVSVTDHGAGVPKEFRSRIFQRFAQVDASDSRAKGGTGLGLNICKKIVEEHGGAIDYTSEPGCTVFFFDLPLAEVRERDPAAQV